MKEWLNCKTSLTEKLKEKLGEASLKVLSEKFFNTSCFEKDILKINSTKVWRREIVMFSKNTAYWYACTIVPDLIYFKNNNFFTKLNSRILGDLIYNSNLACRDLLTYYQIDVTDPLYNWLPDFVQNLKTKLWFRVSTIILADRSLFYLTEIFLPALYKTP